METCGLQPMAIGRKSDRSGSRKNKPETVAVSCDQLPQAAHGKEAVDGIIAMLVPMSRESANTGTPPRSAKVA